MELLWSLMNIIGIFAAVVGVIAAGCIAALVVFLLARAIFKFFTQAMRD